jgi:hypothetical protein
MKGMGLTLPFPTGPAASSAPGVMQRSDPAWFFMAWTENRAFSKSGSQYYGLRAFLPLMIGETFGN